MNDRQIQYLLSIAEEGSINRAAEKLLVSQPSLSHMLAGVEQEIGAVLFDRKHKPLVPTPAGRIYLENLRTISQIIHNTKLHLTEFSKSNAGTLSFGITPGKSMYILPEILVKFKKVYPHLKVDVMQQKNTVLLNLLESRGIDIALVNHTAYSDKLEYVQLPPEEMILIAPSSHPLVRESDNNHESKQNRSISLRKIAREPFIYLSKGHGVYKMIESMFTLLGINPPLAYEISDNMTAHSLVAKGLGLTILPDNVIRHISNKQNVEYFHITDADFKRNLSICYHKAQALPPVILRFVDIAAEVLRDYCNFDINQVLPF